MKRRVFTKSMILGSLAITTPLVTVGCKQIDYDPADLGNHALPLIWKEDILRDIGKMYLETHPKERREKKLIRLLTKDYKDETMSLKDHLKQNIIQDFKSKNTLIIAGWILSKTEARQCALMALTKIN
ncbi:hypothetical protein [Aestuariivivens sediminicola]|uniref:hypothetical protein n=1 Tax=Aestuariivivens sediminicola TaxID=2913560 RepID=UPI001F5A1E23|nr:hypothetical protein [Aestuariivivens sediminicola]